MSVTMTALHPASAGVRQPAAEREAVHPARLPPAVDGHPAVLEVHPDGEAVAIPAQHPGGEVEIGDGHAAQDAPPHPEGEVLFDPRLGADAAAHLDVKSALPGDGPDGLEVGRRAVFGPVQVHQVEAVAPACRKAAAWAAGSSP